uniref:Ig-like domain-containing protein n=1 Tax=Mastacembelus armatus TaxID=205130 RepID=A0A7N8XQ35_9TELE
MYLQLLSGDRRQKAVKGVRGHAGSGNSDVLSDDGTSQTIRHKFTFSFDVAGEAPCMPPRFINPICDMETPEGTTVMFECSLMGIPSPIVSWFKGDKKIPHSNKKYLHSSDGDNHFLKICKVTTLDSGVYTCRAINVVGETLCRAALVVLNAKAFSGKTRGRDTDENVTVVTHHFTSTPY